MKTLDRIDDGALQSIAASPFTMAVSAVPGGSGSRSAAVGQAGHGRRPCSDAAPRHDRRPGVRAAGGKLRFDLHRPVDQRNPARQRPGRLRRCRCDQDRCRGMLLLLRQGLDPFGILARRPARAVARLARTFAGASRFLALATVDAPGRPRPKGHPAGLLARFDDGAMWFADRPGNRRIDSFRNILTQPRVATASIIPSAESVVPVTGVAEITDNAGTPAHFTVGARCPRSSWAFTTRSLPCATVWR